MGMLTECPACSLSDIGLSYMSGATRFNDHKHWMIFRCSDCGHEFLNPQPSWEELAPYYATYNSSAHLFDDHDADLRRAETTKTVFGLPIEPGSHILDIGCGGGKFIALAKHIGAHVTGIEPRKEAADVARNRGVNVFNGSLEDYAATSPEAKFDIITSFSVFEHLHNPVSAFRLGRTLLSAEGFMWVLVPNADYWIAQKLKGRWHSSDIPLHLMHFTANSLRLMGRRAGMEMRDFHTDSPDWAVAGSLRQYLRHQFKVPIRISQRIRLIDAYAKTYSAKLDASCQGEALVAKFTPHSP
jgi:cyclopropane fatty-acyl-phospholipid synthase-like methyltransferase